MAYPRHEQLADLFRVQALAWFFPDSLKAELKTRTQNLFPHARCRGPVGAWPNRITRVLPRRVAEHLIVVLATPTQRGRFFFLFAILIGMAGETGLLSAWFLRYTRFVLILFRSHLANLPVYETPRAACVLTTISDSGALPVW